MFPALFTGLLVLALVACGRRDVTFQGRVVQLNGDPIPGAQVRLGPVKAFTGSDGRFALRGAHAPAWLEISRDGFRPVVRAVSSDEPLFVRLSRSDGQTVVVHAVGDVMAGRRFFSGNPATHQPSQLLPGDGVPAHQNLFQALQPLLDQADLSLLNLESPLLTDPIAERGGYRLPHFHRTKDFVFASSLSLAESLRRAGFDVIGLANNHIFDARDQGLRSTLEALRSSGFVPGQGVFGAGFTPRQAWLPALWRGATQSVAVLGCTTIHGGQHPVSYVASAEQGKAGAAFCKDDQLKLAVQNARRHGPVVAMLHGGNEYQYEPTVALQRMVDAARDAGATLVLNHHSHVIGGLQWYGRTLVASGLGNFLFDQTLWNTFPSLLLEVHLREGAVQRVLVYPLLLQRYRPYAAVGSLATWILRGIAARSEGVWLIAGGVLELDLAKQSLSRARWLSVQGSAKDSHLAALPAGAMLCGWRGGRGIELGRSLLGVGDFEDHLVGASRGDAGLWALFHRDQRLERAAARQGRFGVRLRRSSLDENPVLLRPLHRLPVQPGQRLTFLAWVRGNAGRQARLQISWYQGLRGPSVARFSRPIRLLHHQRWQPVRLDLQVPEHVSAMGPAIALDPPRWGLHALDVDDVELVRWQRPDALVRRHGDWIRSHGAGEICLSATAWPSQPTRPLVLQSWPSEPAPRDR